MRATPRDISFADGMCDALLRSIRQRDPDDLYFQCVDDEARLSAALYRDAADHMRLTGQWMLPGDKELEEVRVKAWARLEPMDA